MLVTKTETPRVSVIVPVYKAEPYIRRCIDSILNQTLTNFELLLVDDGSPDNCGAICDEYAAKDCRVRVIHKQNGGVSSARNTGIDAARGEYVAFIDSDDYVDKEYLEMLTKHNCDFGMCVGVKHLENGQVCPGADMEEEVAEVTTENLLKWASEGRLLVVWGKAYRIDVLRRNNIRFRNDLCYGEDTVFAMMCAKSCRTASFVKKKMYHYIKHPGESLSKRISESSVQSYDIRDQFLISWCRELGADEDFYKKVSLSGKQKMKWAFMEIFETKSMKLAKRLEWYRLFFSLPTFHNNIQLLFSECSYGLRRVLSLRSPVLLALYQFLANIKGAIVRG